MDTLTIRADEDVIVRTPDTTTDRPSRLHVFSVDDDGAVSLTFTVGWGTLTVALADLVSVDDVRDTLTLTFR